MQTPSLNQNRTYQGGLTDGEPLLVPTRVKIGLRKGPSDQPEQSFFLTRDPTGQCFDNGRRSRATAYKPLQATANPGKPSTSQQRLPNHSSTLFAFGNLNCPHNRSTLNHSTADVRHGAASRTARSRQSVALFVWYSTNHTLVAATCDWWFSWPPRRV